MGTDIHSHVEVRTAGQWRKLTGGVFVDNDPEFDSPDEPFPGRNYRLFGFLADVRNYSECPPIGGCRGLPCDVSPEVAAAHGPTPTSASAFWADACCAGESWVTVAELLAFDYDQKFVDQDPYGDEDPNTTVREHLGEWYFERLNRLTKSAPDPADARVVFWFC